MGYSATLGRFISRDPLEYVDGMNPYNYVRNSPLTLLDPFGLQSWVPNGGTVHPDFGGTITLPDGSKAEVSVITGATLEYENGNKMRGPIVFQVETEKGSCADCHFIQFVRSYKLAGSNDNSDFYLVPGNVRRKWGEWYLDSTWIAPESPWYDTYGNHSRSDRRLSIADAPRFNRGTGMEFQLYLVCDDEVLWKFTWKAEAGGEHGLYTPYSGGAADDLGDFANMPKFPMGFIDDGMANPVPPYVNPVPMPASPTTGPTTRPN